MKGNVFQCHGENIDKQQFLKTVGVLEEHINKTFVYPQDVASVCKSFDNGTCTATEFTEERLRRRCGQANDVGDVYEDAHEENGPAREQHKGDLRNHLLGTMQPHDAVQGRVFGRLQDKKQYS
jgi:hypothetical protein